MVTDIQARIDRARPLTDPHHAAGGAEKHKPNRWLRNEQTQALIEEIKRSPDLGSEPIKTVKGGGGATYACKELVYAYAMWISAKFHLAVIRAFDALVSGRAPALPADAPITATQARHLSDIIVTAHPHPGARSRAWWALRRHFGVEHYRDIPAERFEEALAFVKQLRLLSDHDEQNCRQLPVFPATGECMNVLMIIEGDRIAHMQPLNPGEVVIDPAKPPLPSPRPPCRVSCVHDLVGAAIQDDENGALALPMCILNAKTPRTRRGSEYRKSLIPNGGPGRTRTFDQGIMSPLL